MSSGRMWFMVGAAGVVVAASGAALTDWKNASDRGSTTVTREAVRAAPDDVCRIVQADATLPHDVRETSGLARSIARPDVFWTHNDSGNEAEIFGIDESGALVQRVRVHGAAMVDWEDIEAAGCASGTCLYIADTGDNDGERESVTIYEIDEPAAGATSVSARGWQARYPDGPADAESLFMAGGELYLVTKGRLGPIRLYRLPRDGARPTTLVMVVELAPQPSTSDDRVSAATSTPDGRWIVMRTRTHLQFYPAERLLAGDPGGVITWDARGLGHPQGESIAIDDNGSAWLTTEAEDGDAPRFAKIACTL